VLADRRVLPLDDHGAIGVALDRHRPWAVVNAAGWVRVDDAEDDPAGCRAANADGAGALARACATRGIHCTLFSSDLVFDGAQAPYEETDTPAPLGVYGASKAEAERLAAASGGEVLVVRTAAFFSPHDPHNFAMAVEHALRRGERFAASAEHRVSPTYVPDLVQACLDLVIDGATGLWHLTNGEGLTWWEFGRRIADALGLDGTLVTAAGADALGWRATRPRDAVLLSTRGALLPSLDDALARYAAVRRSERPAVVQEVRARPVQRVAA
jgi:dTDP-4-dehydrorhamnose reductase